MKGIVSEGGTYIRMTFTDPKMIYLPRNMKIADCIFEKDSKIVFDEIGVVEHCVFKGNIELETKYQDNPQWREFKNNITFKNVTVKGGIEIEYNYDIGNRMVIA